jgi:eukaryotic-like serine/threonine-protein kinase
MPEPTSSTSHDLTGTAFGDYRVLRRLGRGAMAEVYLADQLSLHRQVALKVLKDELAREEKALRRFRNEAMAAAALVHANIVQIYEVGEHGQLHYIAQEYVSGGTVGDLIHKNVSLDPKMVIAILRQTAAALARAAQEGIVHRDIKPENMLVTRSGEIKVADFGLARAAAREGVDLTQAGVAMGTPLYMSPEQIEGRDLGPASDIYSLGVSTYHMLVGRPPFTGDTPLSVAVQHLNSQPPRIETERADIPPGLARIVHKMLAKKPSERYAGGGELLADLRTVAKDLGGDADWEEWSTAEMLALAGDRADTTARLGKLMKTTTMLQSQRPPVGWFVVAGILAVCLGLLLGAWLRPRPLLAAGTSAPIDRKETVWAQLYQARMIDTPAAWQSVKNHFNDPSRYDYHHQLADLGLALYYYRKEADLQKALALFEELASSTEQEFSAFGLAYTSIIHAQFGNLPQHNDAWAQLHGTDRKFDRLPWDLKREVIQARERNFDRLSQEARQELESIRSELGSAEPEEGNAEPQE